MAKFTLSKEETLGHLTAILGRTHSTTRVATLIRDIKSVLDIHDGVCLRAIVETQDDPPPPPPVPKKRVANDQNGKIIKKIREDSGCSPKDAKWSLQKASGNIDEAIKIAKQLRVGAKNPASKKSTS